MLREEGHVLFVFLCLLHFTSHGALQVPHGVTNGRVSFSKGEYLLHADGQEG